ncbi:MAG: 4Fe-4S dicluster domain-containing protein [Candidatus Lokiarchaeota archaeon]|nr:4Fe-4S dicluster domain-containing protein [Candidatus Lokiarchaeota archaeon]
MSNKDVYEKLANRMSNLAIRNPLTPEFRKILEALYTPEEAEMLLIFKIPMLNSYSAKQIAKKLNKPVEEIEPKLKELARKQRILSQGKKDKQYYSLLPLVPGVFEMFFANHKRILAEEKQIAKLFADEFDKYYKKRFASEMFASSHPLIRVLVDQKVIDDSVKKGKAKTVQINEIITNEMKFDVLLFDQVKNIIENESKIVALDCCCKVYKSINENDEILNQDHSNGLPVNGASMPINNKGETIFPYPINVCMVLGETADYCVEMGFGKYINKNKALEIIRKGSEAGLVHTTQNQIEGISMICNCDPECCISLRGITKYNYPSAIASSNFLPEYDKTQCKLCEKCIEICPTKAIIRLDDYVSIKNERCIGCGDCAYNCSGGAMIMIKKFNIIPPKDLGETATVFLKGRAN